MAKLQELTALTSVADSDKLVTVQAQGQGLVPATVLRDYVNNVTVETYTVEVRDGGRTADIITTGTATLYKLGRIRTFKLSVDMPSVTISTVICVTGLPSLGDHVFAGIIRTGGTNYGVTAFQLLTSGSDGYFYVRGDYKGDLTNAKPVFPGGSHSAIICEHTWIS